MKLNEVIVYEAEEQVPDTHITHGSYPYDVRFLVIRKRFLDVDTDGVLPLDRLAKLCAVTTLFNNMRDVLDFEDCEIDTDSKNTIRYLYKMGIGIKLATNSSLIRSNHRYIYLDKPSNSFSNAIIDWMKAHDKEVPIGAGLVELSKKKAKERPRQTLQLEFDNNFTMASYEKTAKVIYDAIKNTMD